MHGRGRRPRGERPAARRRGLRHGQGLVRRTCGREGGPAGTHADEPDVRAGGRRRRLGHGGLAGFGRKPRPEPVPPSSSASSSDEARVTSLRTRGQGLRCSAVPPARPDRAAVCTSAACAPRARGADQRPVPSVQSKIKTPAPRCASHAARPRASGARALVRYRPRSQDQGRSGP